MRGQYVKTAARPCCLQAGALNNSPNRRRGRHGDAGNRTGIAHATRVRGALLARFRQQMLCEARTVSAWTVRGQYLFALSTVSPNRTTMRVCLQRTQRIVDTHAVVTQSHHEPWRLPAQKGKRLERYEREGASNANRWMHFQRRLRGAQRVAADTGRGITRPLFPSCSTAPP